MHLLSTLITLLCIQHFTVSQNRDSLLEAFFRLLTDGEKHNQNESRDEPNMYPEYDFIVVGAGTAGCVVANRLTENPKWNVLLLEAGASENFIMDFPIIANYLQFTDSNWKYKTQPSNKACLGLENSRCNYPRGKVMGGSSVLNYMIYTRGNKRDYDNWAALGNKGWSYKEVLPYFKRIENFKIDQYMDEKYHNNKGPLTISYPPFHTKIAEAIVQSGVLTGIPYVDYNGATQTGISYIQASMKNGTRDSSNKAYIHPIKKRKNLHVKKYSMVTKILIDPVTKTAKGVQFRNNGNYYNIYAKKEVIISGGAINSPQLLLLSGIGPKSDLQKLGIKVIQDLKVGHNLQDHVALGGLTFIINQPISLMTTRLINSQKNLYDYLTYHTGPFSVPGGCEAIAFYDLKNPNTTDGYPDLELLFQGGSIISDAMLKKDFGISNELYNKVYKPIEGKDSWMVFPMVMRPKSIGKIMLKNADPFTKPLIYHNYFTHQDDLDVLVAGVKKILEINEMEPLKKLGSTLHKIPIPACKHLGFGTDKYWECHARHLTFTIYHQSGTCKMGPRTDKSAVVDHTLKVHGIKGLRVIDASVMPHIPAAHTNAPTYMIAEKGCDMIKADWN